MSKIQKTSNYEIFQEVVGNRKIYPYHVKQLVESINEKNLLEENPILVNGFMQVIDGQHRLEAARRLKVPIFYVEREGASLEDIKRLNVTTKQWTLYDYLHSYIEQGNEDYMQLADFLHKYDLPITVAMALLTRTSPTGGGMSAKKAFKHGTFKVTSLAEGEKDAEAIFALQPFTEGNIWRTREFIRAVQKVWSKVARKAFQEKVQAQGYRLRARLSMKEYLRDFEDIYNYGLKNNQIRFI